MADDDNSGLEEWELLFLKSILEKMGYFRGVPLASENCKFLTPIEVAMARCISKKLKARNA